MTLVNVVDDAAVYVLCALTSRHCQSFHVERMVEPRLLILECLLSLIELVKVRLLPLAIVLVLQRVAASGNVRQCGITFRGAVVGVDRVKLLLEDKTLVPQIMGRRRLLVGRRALGLVTSLLRSP